MPALQAICDSLGEEQIRALLGKWLRILPYPFTEDDIAAGYCYDVSVVQAEFSLTQMLDRPVSGRIFLEQMIRDARDAGWDVPIANISFVSSDADQEVLKSIEKRFEVALP